MPARRTPSISPARSKAERAGRQPVRPSTSGGTGAINFATIAKGSASGLTIVKTGTGTTTLGGIVDNNTAGLTLNGGVVVLNKTSGTAVHALGANSTLTTGTLQLGGTNGDQIYDGVSLAINGGFFDLNGKSEAVGSISAAATGGVVYNTLNATTSTLTVGGSAAVNVVQQQTYAGDIRDNAGSGTTGIVALAKNGFGTVQSLSGTNTYTGGTTINSGLLEVTKGASLTGTVTAAAIGGLGLQVGTTFTATDLNTLFASTSAAPVTVTGSTASITLNNSSYVGIDPTATFSYSVPGSSTHGLAKLGANTLTLATANNYTGNTLLYAGTLSVGDKGSLGSTGTVFTYGGTLQAIADLSGANKLGNALTLNATTTIGGTNNIDIGGLVTGNTLTLTVSNTATTTLSGSTTAATIFNTLNLNGGPFVIGVGGMQINNAGTTTIVSSTNTSISGGQLTVGYNTGNAVDSGDIKPNAGTTLTINSVVASTGTGGFENNGAGTIVLTANNIFPGVLSTTGGGIVSVGTIGAGGTATNAGQGTQIYLTNGTLRYTGAGEQTDRAINLAGTNTGGLIDNSGTGTGTLEFTSTAAITAGGGTKTLSLLGSTSNVGQIDGIIQNNSGSNLTNVFKGGTGTWNLKAVETYTGSTTVNAGTLAVLAGGGLADTAISVTSGTTFAAKPGIGSITAGNTATPAAGANSFPTGRLEFLHGGWHYRDVQPDHRHHLCQPPTDP